MPLVPFIFGAVVGSAITYVVKDDSSKQMLKDTGEKVTDGVGAITGKVTSLFSKAKDGVEEAAEDVADKAAA